MSNIMTESQEMAAVNTTINLQAGNEEVELPRRTPFKDFHAKIGRILFPDNRPRDLCYFYHWDKEETLCRIKPNTYELFLVYCCSIYPDISKS